MIYLIQGDKMLILAKSILAMMIGFILSIIIGFILIPFLRKKKIGQTVSVFLQNKHKEKDGIPTMGGIIFITSTIITIVFLLITNKIEYTTNLFIILFVFVGYGLIGFIDDFLIIKRKNNTGLTEIQKLFGQLVIAIIFFYLFMKTGHEPSMYISTLGIHIHMGWLYGAFILFVLIASSNAVNITDGLDGLAGGLSLIAFLAFGLIAWNSTWIAGSADMAVFCFILVGSLLGFLFYNTHPAKIFMGDTGSLALGGSLAAIAILTNHEITFIIIMLVFIIETLVCIIQTLSVMYNGKKIFLMTPLHHHFEKLGWDERDIVKLFWFFGIVCAMAGVLFAVWI